MYSAETFAESLVSKMKDYGISVNELSEKIGYVGIQAIYKWRKGKHVPDVFTLIDVAKALECSVDDLLGLVDDTRWHRCSELPRNSGDKVIVETEDGKFECECIHGTFFIVGDDLRYIVPKNRDRWKYK